LQHNPLEKKKSTFILLFATGSAFVELIPFSKLRASSNRFLQTSRRQKHQPAIELRKQEVEETNVLVGNL